MAADIFIKSAGLSPNPVIAGAAVTISVEIGDRVRDLADHDGSLITDTDGMGLWIPEGAQVLADHDGVFLVDEGKNMIESEE